MKDIGNENKMIELLSSKYDLEICKKKTEEIDNSISKLFKKENEVLTLYTKKILENPENRCIKKTNMSSMISKIHIGDNKWITYNDNEIYPKFISDLCNSLKELLISKIKDNEIIKKQIEYLDYMISIYNNKENNKDFKIQIQKTKLMVYNVSNI